MRNYFKILQLTTAAPREDIEKVLQKNGDNANILEKRFQADAPGVLLDEQRCQLYTNTVALYERLHQASGCLSAPGTDSHNWQNRLTAFERLDNIADLH